MSYLDQLIQSKFLAIVGLLALIYFSVISACRLYGAIRIFLWSWIGPKRDLVNMYGKWAVITGSTDGIGKEHAKIFAERGFNLCLISRNEEKLENTAKEIQRNANVEVKCIQADFTDVTCYDLIKKGLDEIDDIGILMNNVGMLNEQWEPFDLASESFLRDMINVNILSAVLMTKIVLPRMIAKKRGSIINVSSLAGVCPMPYASVYSSTKAMVSNFSLCLKEELRQHNIRVLCLEPAFVRSNMTKHMTDTKTIVPSFFMPTSLQYSKSSFAIFNLNESVTTTGYWSHGLLRAVHEVFLTKARTAWMMAMSHRLRLLGRTKNVERVTR